MLIRLNAAKKIQWEIVFWTAAQLLSEITYSQFIFDKQIFTRFR